MESIVKQFESKINIEFFRMNENKGTAAVRRFLISNVKQKFVLWLDDDVALFKDAIHRHLTGCSAPVDPGISVGTMEDLPEDKAEEVLAMPLEQRLDACLQRAMPEKRGPFRDPWNNRKAWGACWTGNLMMLKEHGDKAGWLDEDAIGWGHDDTILTVKLVGIGVPVWYDINIRGFHLRQDRARTGNLGKGYYETARHNATIMQKYLHKYGITWSSG
jgi:glycosyltransferase involved in cell wall biosynthesis